MVTFVRVAAGRRSVGLMLTVTVKETSRKKSSYGNIKPNNGDSLNSRINKGFITEVVYLTDELALLAAPRIQKEKCEKETLLAKQANPFSLAQSCSVFFI